MRPRAPTPVTDGDTDLNSRTPASPARRSTQARGSPANRTLEPLPVDHSPALQPNGRIRATRLRARRNRPVRRTEPVGSLLATDFVSTEAGRRTAPSPALPHRADRPARARGGCWLERSDAWTRRLVEGPGIRLRRDRPRGDAARDRRIRRGRRLREAGGRSPILMLTARVAVDERIRALDAGADDYLAKRFSQLAARVRS